MWGKDELNLKLTFFIVAGFFRNLEVLNPGITSVKNIWNLKQVWITPKSLSHFRPFSQVFLKMCSWGMTFKYHITGNSSVFYNFMMLSFNQVNFLGICIHWQFLYVFFWVLDIMNFFESLVVLNVELNHTVELMGLAYSEEFDNIFALSC